MINFKNIAFRLLPPILVPKAWSSPFEAANWSPRRGTVPGASPTDARNELTPGVRTELVRKSRYLAWPTANGAQDPVRPLSGVGCRFR